MFVSWAMFTLTSKRHVRFLLITAAAVCLIIGGGGGGGNHAPARGRSPRDATWASPTDQYKETLPVQIGRQQRGVTAAATYMVLLI